MSNESSLGDDADAPVEASAVDSAHMLRIADLVDSVQSPSSADEAETLSQLNAASLDMMPGATCAGITLVGRDGDITTIGPTHPYAIMLDDAQREVSQGPCMSSAWEQHTVRVDDLWSDRRWLAFRLAAIQAAPIRSILSFRLFEDSEHVAALNLYSEGVSAFDDEAVELGLVLAAHTSLAWNAIRRRRRFQSALASRDVIGQAKGILMERFTIDAVAAFEVMKRLSQDSNMRLAEIAARITTR